MGWNLENASIITVTVNIVVDIYVSAVKRWKCWLENSLLISVNFIQMMSLGFKVL